MSSFTVHPSLGNRIRTVTVPFSENSVGDITAQNDLHIYPVATIGGTEAGGFFASSHFLDQVEQKGDEDIFPIRTKYLLSDDAGRVSRVELMLTESGNPTPVEDLAMALFIDTPNKDSLSFLENAANVIRYKASFARLKKGAAVTDEDVQRCARDICLHNRHEGDSGLYSRLLTSLCNLVHIPSRTGLYCHGKKGSEIHRVPEAEVPISDGTYKWVRVDPTPLPRGLIPMKKPQEHSVFFHEESRYYGDRYNEICPLPYVAIVRDSAQQFVDRPFKINIRAA